MTFGEAIEAMKAGDAVTRTSWTGRNMSLCLTIPKCDDAEATLPYISIWLHEANEVPPYVDSVKTRPYVVPWVASHADMLADDWQKL